VPITNDAGRNVGGENALTTFSLRTGGRVFQASLGAALDQSFDEILRDLRTQYLLAFYPHNVPPTKDRFHRLEVSIAAPALHANPGLQIKARNGYYGEALLSAPAAAPSSYTPGSDSVRPPRPPQPKKRSLQN